MQVGELFGQREKKEEGVEVCGEKMYEIIFRESGWTFIYLIEEKLLCNIVLVFAIHQCESAIGTHMSPPSWTSLLPPAPSRSSVFTEHVWAESYRKFPLPVYLTYDGAHVSMLLAPFVPPSPSHPVSTSLFSTSVSPLLPCNLFKSF